jgi:hypothetical protein
MAKVKVHGGSGSRGGPVCPEGTWPARVIQAEDQASKKERKAAEREGRDPQDNMVVLDLTAWPNENDSFTVTYYAAFEVDFRMQELAAAFPEAVDDGELDTDLIVSGMNCMVKVKHEIYEGRTQAKADGIEPYQDPRDAASECPF